MKRLQLIILFVTISVSGSSQFLEWNDLLDENSGGQSEIYDARFRGNGDVYTLGNFNGTLDLDPDANSSLSISSPSTSGGNVFFASYDSDGELIMGRHIWGKGLVKAGGVSLFSGGDFLVSAYFNDSTDLNPLSAQAIYMPTSSGAEDAIFVKYSSQGNFLWARQLTSSGYTRPVEMEVDVNGNIILVGKFKGQTDFNPGGGINQLTSVDEDIFIAKYNSSGAYVNAIHLGAFMSPVGLQEVTSLEIDNSNNIYITGRFEGSVDFDPSASTQVLTSRGKNDFFIARYNSSLQLDWVYSLGSALAEGHLEANIYGNELWLAGSFRDTIDVNLKSGSQLILSQGQQDVFFAKYSLTANLLESNRIGGSGQDDFTSMDVYNADSLIISGHFEGVVDFSTSGSSKSLTSSSNKSMFFASYNAQGDLNWVSKLAGNGDVTSALVRFDLAGDPHIFGRLLGTSDFNAASVFAKNYTGPASFIAKYKKCGRMDIQVSTQDASCGLKDGSAIASISGGTAPMRYVWTSGHTDSTADSLRSGLYYIKVIDTLNCTYFSDPVMINEIGGASVSVLSKSDVSCYGDKTGAIVLNVSGGTSPYTYKWSNGASSKNLNGLKAGQYEVTVTDKDQCKSHLRVRISQPEPMVVYPVITKPDCSTSNGSVTAVASGGSPTYSYTWQPSGTGNTLFNINSGVYKVIVTDANNCTYTQSIAVSDNNAPDILLDSVNKISCGSGGGGIYVSVSGGNPNYSYLWNPGGANSQDLIGVQGGAYELEVTDMSACKSYFVEEIEAKTPQSPEICIVDVDSINGNAVVVWEKPVNRGSIDFYNVYRETTTLGQFDLVEDSIDFTELSLYEDRFADTWIRPWSYKLTYTDTCGVESGQSEYHTTIHAVISMNAQKEFNVLWSPYQGNFPVMSYTCFRYTDSTGFDSLTTVPANVFTYTDVNSPSHGGEVYYYIRIDHPNGCTATDAQNRNSSRSNRGSIEPPRYLGTQDEYMERGGNEMQIFPNPARNEIFIQGDFKNEKGVLITILDMQGKKHLEKTENFNRSGYISLPTKDLVEGMYIVKMLTSNGVSTGRFVIARNQ